MTAPSQTCGKSCQYCDLNNLCPGCDESRSRRCLVNLCISKGAWIPDFLGDCDTCVDRFHCVKSDHYSKPGMWRFKRLGERLDTWDGSPPILELPKFIPMIPIDNPPSIKWKDFGINTLLLQTSDFENEHVDRVKEQGVHSYLGFDGTVLLSTVMPDKILEAEGSFDSCSELLKQGGFDGVVGWDMPVYVDAPKSRNLMNLAVSTLSACAFVEAGIPVVPLFKGSERSEFNLHFQWLKKLRFRELALHATEYLLALKTEEQSGQEVAKWLMRMALVMMTKFGTHNLIIGVSSPHSIQSKITEVIPGASYSGMSWLLNARTYVAYNGMDTIDLKRSVMECKCPVCLTRPANQISRDTGIISEHNLVQINCLLSGNKTTLRSPEIFDAVIDEGLTAVVACLHIGRERSLWRECFNELERLKPRRVIFLGSTFDFKYGNPYAFEIYGFASRLSGLGTDIVSLRGCTDSSLVELERALHRILFEKNPVKLPEFDDYKLRAVGQLMAFYGMSRSKARIKLPDGRIAIFEHGDGIGTDRTAKVEEIAAHLLKGKEPGTLRVIGHYHRSYFKPDEGIIMLGSWQPMTPEEHNVGTVPDVMDILLISDDGKLVMHKGTL